MRKSDATVVQMLEYGKDKGLTTAEMLDMRGHPDAPECVSLDADYEFTTVLFKYNRAVTEQTLTDIRSAHNTQRTEAYSD